MIPGQAHQHRDLGGLQRAGHSGPLRWHFDNPTDIRELTAGNATQVGRMLLDENTASVNHLYTERDRFRDPVLSDSPGEHDGIVLRRVG